MRVLIDLRNLAGHALAFIGEQIWYQISVVAPKGIAFWFWAAVFFGGGMIWRSLTL